jgi:hypothetical protein
MLDDPQLDGRTYSLEVGKRTMAHTFEEGGEKVFYAHSSRTQNSVVYK